MKRIPTSICISREPAGHDRIAVIADDGSMWYSEFVWDEEEDAKVLVWTQLPNLPST